MTDEKEWESGQNAEQPATPCCRRNAEELGEGWLYDVFFGETAGEEQQPSPS